MGNESCGHDNEATKRHRRQRRNLRFKIKLLHPLLEPPLQVVRAVARFPAEWRQVWEWWVQGERREEMAHRAGKSLRTIQYWLAEMLDQLRESLGE